MLILLNKYVLSDPVLRPDIYITIEMAGHDIRVYINYNKNDFL